MKSTELIEQAIAKIECREPSVECSDKASSSRSWPDIGQSIVLWEQSPCELTDEFEPPSLASLHKLREIVAEIIQSNERGMGRHIPTPAALLPTSNGGVALEWNFGARIITEISREGTIEILAFDKDGRLTFRS